MMRIVVITLHNTCYLFSHQPLRQIIWAKKVMKPL